MLHFVLRYDETGFIVNDVQVQGPVFCIGDLFTMWNIESWQDLGPDSLSMLQLYKPAPGTGTLTSSASQTHSDPAVS